MDKTQSFRIYNFYLFQCLNLFADQNFFALADFTDYADFI